MELETLNFVVTLIVASFNQGQITPERACQGHVTHFLILGTQSRPFTYCEFFFDAIPYIFAAVDQISTDIARRAVPLR